MKPFVISVASSGDESEVRNYILSVLRERKDVTWEIDPLGSLLVQKQGKKRAPHKLMISAHMDEVGMIVTHVNSDSTYCLEAVGGVDASVALGRQVLVGEEHLHGVIGAKPVHLLSADEKKKLPKWDELVLDMGILPEAERRTAAREGTYVYFAPNFTRMGKSRVCSKAIDDRAGCAMLLHLLEQEAPYDFTAAFLVWEEIGLRGAKQPIQSTGICSGSGSHHCRGHCRCRGDAKCAVWAKVGNIALWIAVQFMIRNYTVWHFPSAKNSSGKPNPALPAEMTAVHSCQPRWCRTLAISLPCRYLHSPSCLADLKDLDACTALLPLLIKSIMEEVSSI
ncbi:MAG: M42 family peptidase [Ruminococcus callidus]